MKKLLTEIVGMVLLILIIIVAVTTNGYKKDEQERRGNVTQEKLVTIGFSQVGADSDWRTANSISIKQTFTPERGYDLLFEDAKQKPVQSDYGDSEIYPAGSGLYRIFTGGGKRMGYCIGRGKARRNPGDRDRSKSIGKRYRSLHCVDRFEFLSGRAEGMQGAQ